MTFVRFGLIVTGRGEAVFLDQLFAPVMAAANCKFDILRKSDQLSPVTSPKRVLKMGAGQRKEPTKDELLYGLPAQAYLRRNPNSFVIVVDDLEHDRRPRALAVFERYRQALDTVLRDQGLSPRAAVHFLANMLEAYYFAHAAAANGVAGREVLEADHDGDVEDIRHPKNELRKRWPGFDEVEDGKLIVGRLDLHHVMKSPAHCAWMRATLAWCVRQVAAASAVHDNTLAASFCLADGHRSPITANQ